MQTPATPASRAAEALGLGPVTDSAVRGELAYVALERGGIAVIALEPAPPRLVRRLEEGRRFVRLVLTGDALLAVELREEAHAFTLSTPESPQPTTLARALSAPLPVASAPAAAPPAVASAPDAGPALRVTVVEGGDVFLSGGRNVGLAEGARVRIVAPAGAPRGAEAVLEVVEVREADAIARLGRGESARVGDRVEPTPAPVTARLAAPPGNTHQLRYGFHARPFLAIDAETASGNNARAGGVLMDAFVAYRLPNLPVVLHARLEPVGVGLGTGERHTPGLGYVAATYSADVIEVGLGVGALFGQNQQECFPEYNEFGQVVGQSCTSSTETGVGVQQLLRLGALDGFHLEWSSSILSRENQFVFGAGRGELQLPITTRFSLIAVGGGGRSGYAFGEVGIRSFLKGTGGAGSLLLTGTVGGVSLSDGRGSLAGPSVALGLEWRR
jgi:hypothetical protein